MAHYDETTVKCHGDDKVTVTFTSTVVPALPRQVHRLLLSNLDLLLPPIDVSVFFCYAGDDDAACSRRAAAATTLKAALAKVLGAYFPLAGEVVANAAGEPELRCSGRGVDFTEATTDGVKLRELRLGLPDESVQKLVPKKKSGVMSVQVTKFKCGGAVVGCTFDHRVCDAYSFNMFLVAWAAEARGTSIPLAPSFNRSFLVPCSPPTPCTAGTLADRLFVPVSRVPPPAATAAPPTAFNRIYHVAAADVAALQASTRPGRTKLEAFTAHLWQLYSRARQHLCCMGVVVDGRARMCPDGAMRPYFGNVLTIPYGVISASDLRDMALEDVAEDVHRWVAEAATGEHFRELVDWVEALRPEPTVARAYIGGGGGEGVASCVVSSGLRLPFGEVDFGWGRPAFASYHFPWPSGTGYVMPMPSARGGGDWVVYVHAAPEVVKVMEEEPTVFKAPDSSDIFG